MGPLNFVIVWSNRGGPGPPWPPSESAPDCLRISKILTCVEVSVKRLGARLPPLGSRVRVSVTPCGFRGGRNGIWVGFSRGFYCFSLPQISFHFISPCDGASGVVGQHPCYSRTSNMGLHRISSLDPTLCWTRVEDIYLSANQSIYPKNSNS